MSCPEYFSLNLSNPDQTGLVIASVHDSRTNYIVRTALPNNGIKTASLMAFAGARFSRSDLTAEELFQEIHLSGADSNQKLATIFRNYGHASVADMAQLFAYIENIPQLYCAKFFYETSVGGGQERSTRYQNFGNTTPTPLQHYIPEDIVIDRNYENLNVEFVELQKYALDKYTYYNDLLTKEYSNFYQVDQENKQERSALTARVFDSARYFLPCGLCNRNSLAWITSAREWARIISLFKSQPEVELQSLGEQIEFLFAPDKELADSLGYTPEASDLIRHTNTDETTLSTLNNLRQVLDNLDFGSCLNTSEQIEFRDSGVDFYAVNQTAGSKIIAQNITTLYPNVNDQNLFDWLGKLSEENKKLLARSLESRFDHHHQMGNQYRVNMLSFKITCSVAEGRDLNRHRAWGRFIPMLSIQSDYKKILSSGYTLPLYLSQNPEFSEIRQMFEKDLNSYYSLLIEFLEKVENINWFPKQLILQMLPFGHVMTMYFHASPKEVSYLTKLRVRPGGHINYRSIAYQIAELVSQSDPYLAGLAINESQKPDPLSRAEFIDRT